MEYESWSLSVAFFLFLFLSTSLYNMFYFVDFLTMQVRQLSEKFLLFFSNFDLRHFNFRRKKRQKQKELVQEEIILDVIEKKIWPFTILLVGGI